MSIAGSAGIFFDHAEHGDGPVRVLESEREWWVMDSMGDAVCSTGFDENGARLIADLLNAERARILPNAKAQPRGANFL